MKYLISVLLALTLAFASYSGWHLFNISKNENEIKYDYAEINKIKYGLFNLNIWKEKIFSVIEKKADSFELKASDLNGIRKELENYLYDLHKEYFESGKLVEILMAESSNDKNSLGKMLMGLFKGNIEKQLKEIDFKSKIPGIADQLMKELQNKTPEIKEAITAQISNMMIEEASGQLADQRDPILRKYDIETIDLLNEELVNQQAEIALVKKKWITWSLASLGIALLLLLLSRKLISFRTSMLWLTLICTIFLAIGLALPMIDLDARLSSVDLTIMGENIHFDEQVMYYQSKSIIDVTHTLITGRGIDLKIVGLLILLFSIVLPLLKMTLSTFYLFKERMRSSKFAELVIFYLGKWSMADVFVVAIFMSYIGFYGLISSQLGDLSQQSDSYALDTVNYSKLSVGIVYFTIYCILSIIMSSILQRKYKLKNV